MATLSIISINILSLTRRYHDVLMLIDKHHPHLVCLQETWLTTLMSDEVYKIAGYTIIRADRANDTGYGGVMMYIRSDVSFRRLHVSPNITRVSGFR